MNAPKNTVIEPEIIDENGLPVAVQVPRERARPQGDTSGILGSMLVLAVGFFTTVAVILFSVFILCPLMLLGRLLHFEVRSFRR